MRTAPLKLTRIGNSRGVRLPAETIRRYGISETVIMEERPEGILLHAGAPPPGKLSWEDTARAMARGGEEWSDWDTTAGDGIESIPWEHPARVIAELPAACGSAHRRLRKTSKDKRPS